MGNPNTLKSDVPNIYSGQPAPEPRPVTNSKSGLCAEPTFLEGENLESAQYRISRGTDLNGYSKINLECNYASKETQDSIRKCLVKPEDPPTPCIVLKRLLEGGQPK